MFGRRGKRHHFNDLTQTNFRIMKGRCIPSLSSFFTLKLLWKFFYVVVEVTTPTNHRLKQTYPAVLHVPFSILSWFPILFDSFPLWKSERHARENAGTNESEKRLQRENWLSVLFPAAWWHHGRLRISLRRPSSSTTRQRHEVCNISRFCLYSILFIKTLRKPEYYFNILFEATIHQNIFLFFEYPKLRITELFRCEGKTWIFKGKC